VKKKFAQRIQKKYELATEAKVVFVLNHSQISFLFSDLKGIDRVSTLNTH